MLANVSLLIVVYSMKNRNIKFFIIFLSFYYSAAGFTFAQNSKPKIRIKNDNLIFSFQGKAQRLNIRAQIDAEKITDAEILFINPRNDFIYLVISVCGQSREKQNDRQCGAGVECNLIWIKLDSKRQIVGVNSLRYESCWSSATSNDGYKINGNNLTIEFDNFREKLNYKVSYNADEAEKGFKIEKMALEENLK